jgi:hypothetical protein
LRLTDIANNTRNISAVSNPATSIDITSDNTNNTLYPVFTNSAGVNRELDIDDSTTALTYNPSTSQLTCSQVNADIQSQNTTQAATHFISMFDSSATGYGRPQKSTGLTFVPSTSTLTITDGTNNTIITPISNPATTITTTSDNTSGTYYIPFTKTGAGTNQQLFVDDTVASAGPLTYNPSTATLTAAVFSGNATTATLANTTSNIDIVAQVGNFERNIPYVQTGAGTRQPYFDSGNTFQYNPNLKRLTVSYLSLTNTVDATSVATFNAGTLTIPVLNSSFSTFNWTYSHTSTTAISTLTFTNMRAFGYYTMYFTNNSGSSMNWNIGLGANVVTNYGTARAVANGGKAIVKFNYDGTTYYVDFQGY